MSTAAFMVPFVAGFLAVLVFHQGVWALFSAAGKTPAPAWSMVRVAPLGVPQVISSAIWGGLWGIALVALAPLFVPSLGYWPGYVIVGSIATTLVALLIIFPMKGRKFAAGWNPAIWVFALLVNGAWGLGTAAFLRLLGGLF